MLNRSSLARLIVLVTLLLAGTAAVQAQSNTPNAPTATRVRVAHLAPFPNSNNATISVQIAAAPVGGTLLIATARITSPFPAAREPTMPPCSTMAASSTANPSP